MVTTDTTTLNFKKQNKKQAAKNDNKQEQYIIRKWHKKASCNLFMLQFIL